MSKKPRVPSYRFHKGSGQAVVVLSGTSVYLGKWNTPDSLPAYERVLAEWLANGRRWPVTPSSPLEVPNPSGPTTPSGPASFRVSELIAAFWRHAQKHYRDQDGKPTRELDNFRDALRPLRRLYGSTPASDFGPLALRAVREDMIQGGLCRTVINARVNRIRRVFRWAASVELIVCFRQACMNLSGRSARVAAPLLLEADT
jgi:hypothetical protein